ncbi:hypothetical protein [Halomontanus rarus]|uniref:hypothetical protein n=1 Tax=Halomontanus rarus TaxID=3034020 RepID=UPI0023E817B5|nr:MULTISPECIES: hypothetical protein [unclassified Halovivax]
MLEHTRNAIANRFDHPLLVFMYIISALFGLSAGIVQALITLGVTDWAMGAAFLVVYMVFFAAIGTTGYTVLLLSKGLSVALDSVGPTN